ncbi:MAG: phage tail tape measure protein, partial [Oscillospiraceae bacterium]|nr:phage tail tape measure protein [Oscillospiraceae bacterium]
DKKAVKAEKAAESAEKMSAAAQKEAQTVLEEAECLEKTAEAAKQAVQAEERLSDSAGMVAFEENKAANALDKSEKEAKEYSEAMAQAADDSEKLGEKGTGAINDLKDVIVNAGIVMGLKKIGDAFLECSRSAAEFESGIAKVSTIADTSRVSLSTIEADIMSLSRKTGQSAGDITEAAYQAMSASVDTASAVRFVDEANKLAVGGFTQQATAADVLTTAINAYGLQVSEATRLSDMLIMTQNLGKTTVDELAQNMGRVIPLASAYNVEMDNLSAAYAEMTKNGIATAESTTYIKSMLNELGSSGSEVSKVLTEQTGQSFAQLMQDGYSLGDVLQVLGQSVDGNTTAFNNLWGSQEAGIGALSLFNSGAAAFNGTLREMQGSAGATEKAYSAMTDTTEFAAQRMSNSFSNLKLTVGGQLNPVMEELYNRVADTIDSFTTFAEENPEVVAGISSLVTGISMATVVATGFNGIIKVVIPSLKALGVAAKANPVIAIVSGVT